MVGFCGIFNMGNGRVSFDSLKRMNLTRGFGCAFLTRELGLLCSGMDSAAHSMQPLSLRYNNAPYTAAAVCSDSPLGENGGKLARSVIEAYIEEGDSFLRRSADGFSFCLYDGRCGELMLLRGNSPLFTAFVTTCSTSRPLSLPCFAFSEAVCVLTKRLCRASSAPITPLYPQGCSVTLLPLSEDNASSAQGWGRRRCLSPVGSASPVRAQCPPKPLPSPRSSLWTRCWTEL